MLRATTPQTSKSSLFQRKPKDFSAVGMSVTPGQRYFLSHHPVIRGHIQTLREKADHHAQKTLNSIEESIIQEFFSAVGLDNNPGKKSHFTLILTREEKSFCVYETKDSSSDEDGFCLIDSGENQVIEDHTGKFISIYKENMNYINTTDCYDAFLRCFQEEYNESSDNWSHEGFISFLEKVKKSDFEHSVSILNRIFQTNDTHTQK